MTRHHPLLVARHWVLAVMSTMALVAAAVCHQVIRRDGVLRRMWFGRRT